MAAGPEELKTVLLESLKMQAESRYALKLLKLRIDFIENRMNMNHPLPSEAAELWEDMKKDLEGSLKDLDERFNELLSAMERYSNG